MTHATPREPVAGLSAASATKGTVLIKLVDSAGKTLPEDAKELLSVKELQTVVIKGHTRKGEDNSVSVVASGIFIKNK